MQAIGSAPTKLLLFGEHSAVYGYPAIGIPLTWKITVELKDSGEMRWNIDQKYVPRLNPILVKLPEVFPELHSLPPLEISIDSEAPIGVGFGSSGALCVAMTRSIFSKLDQTPSSHVIWSRAHALETYFHTHPSGVDTGISTMEQGGYLKKNGNGLPSFQPLKERHPCLIVGAFPRSSNTSELVSNLRDRLKVSPQLMQHIEQLGKIADQSLNQLSTPAAFGELATLAHSHLQALDMSIPELDHLLEHAQALGACGGKLSGAGGGGAFYIVCENRNSAEEIMHQLQFSHLITSCIVD